MGRDNEKFMCATLTYFNGVYLRYMSGILSTGMMPRPSVLPPQSYRRIVCKMYKH